ncbi:MAG: efflux RND transporter permease subunit [Hyphomicrobiaceae bacterium]
MTGITAFALQKDRVALLFIVIVAVAGFFAYLTYPKQEDPSIQIREAVVWAHYPGMAPQRVEDLITRKLEEQIRLLGDIDYIESDSKRGMSFMHVIARDEVPALKTVWRDLRDKLNDVAPSLPKGTIGPFINDEFGLTAVATIALWADGFSLAETRLVARDLRNKLYSLKGIRRVELFGVQEQRVFLELSSAKLSEFGVSPRVVVETLQQQNIILPGGLIDVRGQNVVVEPTGDFDSVSEIEDVIITVPGTERVTPLRDLAKVTRGYIDPPNQPVYYNGRPAIVLSVSILEGEGVNAVEFGERLTRKVRQFEQTLPIGYVLNYATYQPPLIQAAVQGAVNNLLQTLVIVLVVVVIFLGLRTGLIVGAFVPMTMLVSISIMRLLDIELQRMSIASLIIALGMLVDNGIVIAEDIRTRLQNGEERRQAALTSGRTLAIPLLISTLTTILAFAPIPLAIGGAGEYTKSLGIVLIITLLSSWFLSMLMTPLMCVWFMKVETRKVETDGRAGDPYGGSLYRTYQSILETMLRSRLLVIGCTIAAFVSAVLASQTIVKEFFPAGDRNQYLVYLDLPAGSRSDKTADVVLRLSRWLQDKKANPEVTGTVAYVGAGGPRFFLSLAPIDPDPHVASLIVNTNSADQVPTMVERTREFAQNSLPEAFTRVKAMWLGSTETGLFEVRLSGPAFDVLFDKTNFLMQRLRAISGIIDVRQDWENRILRLSVKIDQARARRAGVTSRDVANSLSTFVSGAEITEYREGDETIPVVLRGTEAERANAATFRSLKIYSSARGTSVPLEQIADIEANWDFYRIKRRGQERTVTISAKHPVLKADQIYEAMRPAIEALDLPPGYQWQMGGELEQSAKAQGYLFANMPYALAGIVFLLVWQFNSFRRAGIILLTIPLTFIGATIGLIVMNSVFGFMVILGLLSLAGIIVNNGIVLIDRIDIEIEGGRQPYDAIVTACLARLRPILMTTVTTILGLMTLILSVDPLFFGMAVAIAFGLGVATIFTLGVVPVLYAMMFRVKNPPRTTEGSSAAGAQV